MPTSNPRGSETYTDLFDVEPCYAHSDESVYLYLREEGEQAIYRLSRESAEGLRDALSRVLEQGKPA